MEVKYIDSNENSQLPTMCHVGIISYSLETDKHKSLFSVVSVWWRESPELNLKWETAVIHSGE